MRTMKRLNKDILIAGRIRNLDTATLPALETQVRIDIYSLTGGYWKNFRIRQVADREIEFSFERTLNDPRILDPDLVFNLDAAAVVGLGLDGFRLPEPWMEPPYGHTYFFEKSVFIDCYRKSTVLLGGSRIKDMAVDADYARVAVRLVY